MRGKRDVAAVLEFDIQPVGVVVLPEFAGMVDGVHIDRGCTANRAGRCDKVTVCDASNLGKYRRKFRSWKVIEDAAKAKTQIDARILLGQRLENVANLECEFDAGKAGQILGKFLCAAHLVICDIEPASDDPVKAERACAGYN